MCWNWLVLSHKKKGFSNFHEFGVPLLITWLLLDCKLFKIINELY